MHFNAGLWDTLCIYGDGAIVTPSAYKDNIERIAKRIKFLFPETKIIFATSTPVIESRFIKEFETRYSKDIEAYNEIACEEIGIDESALIKPDKMKYHNPGKNDTERYEKRGRFRALTSI